MKTIKRIFSGVFAKIDQLADQVENHEALVNSSIKELERAIQKSQFQFNKVEQDSINMHEQKIDLNRKVKEWEQRAIKIASSDREKALECLKRKQLLEARFNELDQCSKKHKESKEALKKNLNHLQEQLATLKQRRNILLTKESQAQALRSVTPNDSLLFDDLNQIFQRWELAVAADPVLLNSSTESVDALELEFVNQEERARLSEELDKLAKA